VRADPRGEKRLVDVTGGDCEHGHHALGVFGTESTSVDRKKELDRNERGALVPTITVKCPVWWRRAAEQL